MVPVQVLRVDRVVHPMMAGRVEHPLEGPQPIDELGMDPELVQQTDRATDSEHQRVNAHDRQR